MYLQRTINDQYPNNNPIQYRDSFANFSTFPITSAIPWKALSELDHEQVPAGWHEWLSDRGSLTARLVDASENKFSVEVLNQYEFVPSESEAAALDMSTSTPAMIREVILCGKGKPWCSLGASYR